MMRKTSKIFGAVTLSAAMLAMGVPAMAQSAPTNLSWFSDVTWWTVNWNNKPGTVYHAITQKTGLTFTTDVPPADPDTKLNLMLATGKLPDLVTTQSYDEVDELQQSGKFWNLEQFFKKYDPAFLKQFPAGLVRQEQLNFGAFDAIPSYATTASEVAQYPSTRKEVLDSANQAIVFNQYWMKKAGITLADVKTEAGLTAALKKVASLHLTYKGQPVIPLEVDPSGDWEGNTVDSLAQMFGAMPVTRSGNYRDLSLAPEMEHAIDFLNTLAQDNVINPSGFTEDITADNGDVTSGRVFAFLGNTGNPQWSELAQNNPQMTWVSPGNILSNQGTRPVYGYSNYLGWTMTMVAKDAPDPAKIAKFLAYMWSPAGNLMALDGIPGVDWHWQHGKVVQNSAITKKLNADSTYWSTSGIDALWFFNTPVYVDAVTPPPTASTAWIGAMKEARAITAPVYDYNASPLTMPANLIAPNSTLYNDQQEISQYWDEQLAEMIFAPTTAKANALYRTATAKELSLGLSQIDAVYNRQFHKQEREEHITVRAINP